LQAIHGVELLRAVEHDVEYPGIGGEALNQ